MEQIGTDLKTTTKEATSLFSAYGHSDNQLKWNEENEKLKTNITSLKEILDTITLKIKNRDTTALVTTWGKFHTYSDDNKEIFDRLENFGLNNLPEEQKENWNGVWNRIKPQISSMRNHAEACSLHLQMIEKLKPDEIDTLTDSILRHIPYEYSVNDADKYTEEFIKAYQDLKREASQKKNLWDKFLDILAGGVQETAAERVMMQRWIDGEKGDL